MVVAAGTFASVSDLQSAPAGASALAAPSIQTPVMGPSLLNADQLAAWYHTKHSAPANLPNLHNDIKALAQIYIAEGNADGVRGDIAFVQGFIETGAFSYPSYGQIPPTFNNFAGIYAYNHRPKGTTCAAEKVTAPTLPSRCFASPSLGVRYQIQLLRGYADVRVALMTRLIKPPSDRIGAAPWWELFGGQSGRAIWATALNYGTTILATYQGALAQNGVNAQCLLYFKGAQTGTVGNGYWLFGADGATYPFGTATSYGDLKKLSLWGPIVSGEATPDKRGYWMLGFDGGIFSFGSARFRGSLGGVKLWAPVNDFATTPSGNGYWLIAYDGGVFTFGDARFHGSLGGIKLASPVIGVETTRSGAGYWLAERTGKVWAFGDAKYYGNVSATGANVVEVKRTPSSNGYYELRRDGSVATFGDAHFYGDQHACGLAPASHMIVSPTGKGYWIVSTTGSVLAFGDAKALGMPATTTGGVAGFALKN